MVAHDGPDLTEALASVDSVVVEAWATRPGAVPELVGELSGERRVPLPDDVSGKEMVDRFSDVVVTLARRQPEMFWDAFSTDRWSGNSLVVRGLGEIDSAAACTLLVAASRQGPEFHRMDAVIGLGKQSDPAALPALVRALDDGEYLVRYHALQGLRERMDGVARAAVEAFRARTDISDYEKRLAAEVLAAPRSAS